MLVCLLKISITTAQKANLSYGAGSPPAYIYKQGIAITPLIPSNSGGGLVPKCYYGSVSTAAGSGTAGLNNATSNPLLATFNTPNAVAADTSGNIYVADASNNVIRKINLTTGAVTTLAGSGTAGFKDTTVGASALFNNPTGIAIDTGFKYLYVADCKNNRIRKIVINTGVVTTIAGSGVAGFKDSTGVNAMFSYPTAIAINPKNVLFVSDLINCRIRQIATNGTVTTLAGSGIPGNGDSTTGAKSTFLLSKGVLAADTSNVYLADWGNHKIRKIVISNGLTSTIAGGSQGYKDTAVGSAAMFNHPAGITIEGANLYIADEANNAIRKIVLTPPYYPVTTFAGNGTAGNSNTGVGTFYGPKGIVYDGKGHLYVADALNNQIRMINIYGYIYSPSLPSGLSFGTDTGRIYGTPTAAKALTTYSVIGINAYGRDTAYLNITVKAYPDTITSFSPIIGGTGTIDTIKGHNFNSFPKTSTTVTIAGLNTTVNNIVNDSTMYVTIIDSSTSTLTGNVIITTPGGISTPVGTFTYIPAPKVYNPPSYPTAISGGCGAKVVVSGKYFYATSGFAPTLVKLAGTQESVFSLVSSDSKSGTQNMSVTVSAGAAGKTPVTGSIKVTTPSGTDTVASMFTYIPWNFTSFSPNIAVRGDQITISGSNFLNYTVSNPETKIDSVRIGGIAAKSFSVVNDSTITAVVATGAVSGSVVLYNHGGCTFSKSGFLYDSTNGSDYGYSIASDKNGNLFLGNAYDYRPGAGLNEQVIGKLNSVTGLYSTSDDFDPYASYSPALNGPIAYSGSYLYATNQEWVGPNALDLAPASSILRLNPSDLSYIPLSVSTASGDPIQVMDITPTGINPESFYIMGFDSINAQMNIYTISTTGNSPSFTATFLDTVPSPQSAVWALQENRMVYNNGYIYFLWGNQIAKVSAAGTSAYQMYNFNFGGWYTTGLTTDGNNLYVNTASDSVYKVPFNNLSTKSLIATKNTFPTSFTNAYGRIYGITYNGAGKLYVNGQSSVFAIDTVTTIPSKVQVFSVTPSASVTTETGMKLKLYPNPSSVNATLLISGMADGVKGTVTITSQAGKTVWSKSGVDNTSLTLPTTLPAGFYFVTVNNGTEKQTIKWIKAQ